MKKYIKLLFLSILFISGCAELAQVLQGIDTDRPLTQTEVVSGLKDALKVGTNSASATLSKIDGYYKDELVKILLPPEASVITDNLHRIPGGDQLLEDLILRINRSAENAAKEVTPIFVNAITQMTIQDGFAILKGDKDAATQYLKNTSYQQLFKLYQPKIENSLNQSLVAGVSTNETWESLTSEWNKLANSAVGRVAGFNPVNIKLDEYLTEKALEGLFLKLAVEEGKIRTDPLARTTEIIKRVFGSKEAENI